MQLPNLPRYTVAHLMFAVSAIAVATGTLVRLATTDWTLFWSMLPFVGGALFGSIIGFRRRGFEDALIGAAAGIVVVYTAIFVLLFLILLATVLWIFLWGQSQLLFFVSTEPRGGLARPPVAIV